MRKHVLILVFVVISLFVAGTLVAMAQETKKEAAKTTSTPAEDEKIDINSAPLDLVEELPGIGIKLAQAIIDGRPYEKIEDLLRVKGIGEKRFARLKDWVVAKPIEARQGESKAEPKKTP